MILDEDGVVDLLKKYDKESKAIKSEILRMCWFMRGSIEYNEAMLLSEDERNIIGKIIEENIEITKKTGLPYF